MKSNDDLLKLLSFADCNSREDVCGQALAIATELIQNWKIVSSAGERRFWGLEFYIYIPEGVFEDEATHCREEQLQSGTFYFHTKSKSTWTPPIFNRHGVDITCGDEGLGIYGGILLRHLGGNGHRDGSGLALRSMVRGDNGFNAIKRGSLESKWSNEEIGLFERVNGKPVFGDEVYLQHAPSTEEIKVEAEPRIGIDKTNYAQEKLRFIRT